MKLDQRVYNAHLAMARLELAIQFAFDPNEHPRDLEGRFRRGLSGLVEGGTLKTSDGRTIRKSGGFFHVKGPEGGRATKYTTQAPSLVTHAVLMDSAASTHAKSVGGSKPIDLPTPDHHKIVAYHGRVRDIHPLKDKDLGPLYVAPDVEHAAAYAKGNLVYKVEHDAENPLVLDTPEKVLQAFKDAGIKALARSNAKETRPAPNFGAIEAPAFAKWAKEQGHDAVVITPSAFRGQKHNALSRTWGMPQAIILDRSKSKIGKHEA